MLPVLEGFTTNTAATTTALTLTKPTGVTFGDTLFILVGSDDNAAAARFSISGTDWTKKFEFGNALSDCHLALFMRTADGSEAATQDVDHVTADDLWGVYGRVSGAGGEPGFELGTEAITGSSTSHVAAELDPAPEDVLGLYAMAFDLEKARRVVPPAMLKLLMSLGVLLYVGTGFESIVLGGNFLEYRVLADDPVHGQHLGILLIELGVGITVAAVIITIYYCFVGRQRD